MDTLDKLIQKEEVTYQQLEAMYRKCQASLDEFEEIFQEKRDCMNRKDEEMLHLQSISKDIRSLSQRVVKLERKIENVSRTILKGGKERDGDSDSPCPTDRKLLPSQRKNGVVAFTSRKENSPNLTISSVSTGTPFMIPESGAMASGSQSGGCSSSCPSKKTKDVTWSEKSGQKRRKSKETRKSPVWPEEEDEKRMTTMPVLEKESYEKVSKLIPELLTKFEEFHHQSLNRGPKEIEEATAANILKVMRMLEGLEMRLARGCLDVKEG